MMVVALARQTRPHQRWLVAGVACVLVLLHACAVTSSGPRDTAEATTCPALASLTSGLAPRASSASVCPVGNTCCKLADVAGDDGDDRGANAYGCCPSAKAACCAGGKTCCAEGYRCSNSGEGANLTAYGTQQRLGLSSYFHRQGTDICVAIDPAKHPDMKWMPQYNLCKGPLPVAQLTDVVSGGNFLYYSTNGGLENPANAHIRAAVVVIHGSDRNADDYFCSAKEAAALQSQYASSDVAVVAPWFMEPQDHPAKGVVYWNGDDPNGVWRNGEQSEASATPSGQTISSYAIIDRMLHLLSNQTRYPVLELVAVVGHSSGGQFVQRYTLTQHFGTSNGSNGSYGSNGVAGGLRAPHVRSVVANPSSYCYLNGMRWVNGTLREPTAAEKAKCPDYNIWHWGLGGGFPPYVAESAPLKTLLAEYRTKDVVYLLGGNDTCNPSLIPGCQSHGLETTCADMLEGRFRLERGKFYYNFLQKFYSSARTNGDVAGDGAGMADNMDSAEVARARLANGSEDRGMAVHKFSVVPNVGHDHTLMFQSSEGLQAIFAPPSRED